MVDHLEGRTSDTGTELNSTSRPANFSADDFPSLVADSKKAGNNSKKANNNNNNNQNSFGSGKNDNSKTSTKSGAKKQIVTEGKSKTKVAKQESQSGNGSSEKKMENFPDLEDTETYLFKSVRKHFYFTYIYFLSDLRPNTLASYTPEFHLDLKTGINKIVQLEQRRKREV